MAMLDTALILQPFPEPDLCGEDVRYDSVYDRIAELARADPEGLSMGIWERELKRADWPGVAELCYGILTTRSKDLQVAAWFGESLVNLYGVNGAALGWSVFTDLTIGFWQAIFPRIEDDDIECRLRPVYCISKQLEHWLNSPKSRTGTMVTGIPWALPEVDEGTALSRLLSDVCRLESFLGEELGNDAPQFTFLSDPIRNRLSVLSVGAEGRSSAQLGELELPAASHAGHWSGGLESREGAYSMIREAADFLRKTEPHSPVPMILTAIVDWRDWQFDQLLARMPQDRGSLYELLRFFKQDSD